MSGWLRNSPRIGDYGWKSLFVPNNIFHETFILHVRMWYFSCLQLLKYGWMTEAIKFVATPETE
jgi:hypothetical protein